MLLPERDFAARIIMESDLSDLRYLYYYDHCLEYGLLINSRNHAAKLCI